MSVRFYQVDAFSHGPFTGNSAAVCLLDRAASAVWMQAVASEMNLAETAFVSPHPDAERVWALRWFTPEVEVDLCGHATLASAHVMYQDGVVAAGEPIVFSTASGTLRAERLDNATSAKIELDFPECAPVASEVPAALAAALHVDIAIAYANGMDLLIELPDEAVVRSLEPDFVALKKIKAIRGVIVTSASESPEYDFVSRFFGPAVGIDEDPVTGSAHCCLAPYWSRKLEKQLMRGYQASRRGGVVEVELHTRDGDRRVKLRGSAELILRGELLVDPYVS